MFRTLSVAIAMLACSTLAASAQEQSAFAQARAAQRTTIQYESSMRGPLPTPPRGVFEIVRYSSPVGELGAYLTPDPGDGARRPAIIWLTGGESNTVGDVWSPASRTNDQNATAFREAGIVMMFPSLRGGNNNPGRIEGMYGEIDDVLAAADYLGRLPYVDPQRIYLGGHSTGGTLVLLVAATSDRFRAVFSFGPVSRASLYGEEFIPANFRRLPAWEERSRAPIEWLSSIRSPTFVIEGAGFQTNDEDLRLMRGASTNPNIRFIPVSGANHFSVLAPANEMIARAILADTGAGPSSINLDTAALEAAFRPQQPAQPGPRFVRQPSREQLMALYPPAAQAAGVEGGARVSCIVQSDYTLDECEVLSEEPAGHGFGEAAIMIMRTHMEVAPTTGEGTQTVGARVVRGIRFIL